METIANIINAWLAVQIPIEEGSLYFFEKTHEIVENPEIPMECKIIMKLHDRHTYKNGMPFESSHVGMFFTKAQNSEPTLRAIENRQFQLWLEQFTENHVKSRKAELQDLRNAGQNIEQRP